MRPFEPEPVLRLDYFISDTQPKTYHLIALYNGDQRELSVTTHRPTALEFAAALHHAVSLVGDGYRGCVAVPRSIELHSAAFRAAACSLGVFIQYTDRHEPRRRYS